MLLCNTPEMGEYTKAVSGQGLGKHFLVVRQEVFINATVRLQKYKSSVFYVVRAEML
jgi:hypothetical protein